MTELEEYVEIRKRARRLLYQGIAYVSVAAEILDLEGLYVDLIDEEKGPFVSTTKGILEALNAAFLKEEEEP